MVSADLSLLQSAHLQECTTHCTPNVLYTHATSCSVAQMGALQPSQCEKATPSDAMQDIYWKRLGSALGPARPFSPTLPLEGGP
jgi:hypothetical protein